MEKLHHIKQAFALLCVTFIALSAWGQEFVTKSGTPIVPAEKPMVSFATMTKGGNQLESSFAGIYTIVTTGDLIGPLQPFIQWKRQQGYRVRTHCPDTPHRDSIRAFLSSVYQACPSVPFYVLIVGDVDRIPAFTGKNKPSGLSNHHTDLYFGEYTGDYIPEAMVGRISVSNPAELENVIQKTILYEQGYFAANYTNILLVAGEETRSPAPITTNGQVNYLSQLSASFRPTTDTVCFHNPASGAQIDSILVALEQGNTLVNFTAHCTTQGWNRPFLSISSLDTLDIPTPTIFINNCCLSNAFNTNCFGEELLRKPNGGAVAVIGATNETLWNEDYLWAVGAKWPYSLTPEYDSLLPGAFDPAITFRFHNSTYADGLATLGALLHNGCSAVTTAGSPFDAFYWEIYCLLGDPSMTPFWNHPDTLTITAPDSITAGSTSLTIHGTPYSRISITSDTTLLATAIANAEGNATLRFSHALDGDSLTITATRAEAICHISTHAIHPPQQAMLAPIAYHLQDSLISIKIKNTGMQPAIHHFLQLSPDPTPLDQYTAFIPHLNSLQDTTISFILSDTLPYTWPRFSASLLMQDSNHNTYSSLLLSIPLPDIRPLLTRLQLLDTDSLPCRQLLPGKDYLLACALAHKADSVSVTIADLPALTLYPSETAFVTLFHTPDSFQHLHIVVSPLRRQWSKNYSYWLTAFRTSEGFESGDLARLPWQQTTLFPWLIDSTHHHNGKYSLRSAPINNSQKSTIALDLLVVNNDSISFHYSVSSEAKDWLLFYIDGRRRGFWSGNTGWSRFSYPLTSGQHHIEWVYQKDASLAEHDDCTYIDDISLPLSLWTQPYGTPDTSYYLAIPPHTIDNQLLTLFPNPTRSLITIQLPQREEKRAIMVFDNLGRLVDKIIIPPNSSSTQYSTSHLRLGIYTLVMHDKKNTLTKKMIVIR